MEIKVTRRTEKELKKSGGVLFRFVLTCGAKISYGDSLSEALHDLANQIATQTHFEQSILRNSEAREASVRGGL